MYPAAVAPLYQLFYAAAPHIVAAYLAFSLSALLFAATLVVRALVRRGFGVATSFGYVTVALLCTYPIWFALTQGNIEIVIWTLLAGGVSLYWRGHGYSAMICFGVAAAAKLYPALFLVLPLYRREWRQAIVGAVVAASYSFGSLLYVGPTFSQASRGIAAGLNMYNNQYMLRIREETGVDHSLFAIYKLLFRNHVPAGGFTEALPIYLGVMTFVVLALLATRVRRLPPVNQLAFCFVVCVLFPPVSFEYTLLNILTLATLLLFFLVDAVRADKRVPGLLQALLCCMVCLMFLPELIYSGHQIGGQVKSLSLIVLLWTVLRYPFQTGVAPMQPGIASRIVMHV